MTVNRPDESLLFEARAGNSTSFSTLFQRHRDRVFRHAYGRLHRIDDAEDAVANVFLEMWRKRATVRVINKSVLPWLISTTSYIVLNLSRSERRHRNLLGRVLPTLDQPDHAELFLEQREDQQRAEAVRRAITQLSHSDGQIVVMCAINEMPVVCVASALALPPGTVKSRFHRAKMKLRKLLEEDARFIGPHRVGTP